MPRSNSSSASNSAPKSPCNSVCRPVPSTSPAAKKWRSRRWRQRSSACSRSPRPAAAAITSNWSVTLAMALTTTKGRSGKRVFTMDATRSMAAASSMDVPPNFMTITATPPAKEVKALASRQEALRLGEVGVEKGGASGGTNGVVREHSELVVEHPARAKPAHAHRHPIPAVHVEARLRPVRRGIVKDRLRGRQRQFQFLRSGVKLVECRDQLVGTGLPLQLYRHGFGVAIFHRNSIAVCRHAKGCRFDPLVGQFTEKFAGLLLHLFFFLGDVGNDVAENVERSYSRITCAADGLHGGNEQGLDAEFLMQRRQRHHQSNRRTVRVGNDVSARLLAPILLLDQGSVAGVHFGDDQRDVFLHPKSAGIADHGATGRCKLRLELARDARIQRGEDDPGRAFRSGIRHLHPAYALGDGSLQTPAHGFPIGLSSGTIRSCQPRNFEPGMGFEQLQETLADNAGSAQNSDRNFLLRHSGERPSYTTFDRR